MRIRGCLATAVSVYAAVLVPCLHAEQGLLSFVFGPNSPEAARQSARAASAAARHWTQTSGRVDLRRSGNPEVQSVDPATDAREIDQLFADAILAARDTDPSSFLTTLDAAVQAAAPQTGLRIVIAILNAPSFSRDGEAALDDLARLCQSRGVRVLIFDVADDAKRVQSPVLDRLVAKTGGAWVRRARDLDTQIAVVTPPEEPAPGATPLPKPASSAPAATDSATPTPAAGLPAFEIPVRVRFLRTSGTGSTSESIVDRETDFGMTVTMNSTPLGPGGPGAVGGGGGSMEVSYWPNDPHAPLQGLVTVESPLTAIRLAPDDAANTYQGHARITVIVRDAKKAAIWTAHKDVNIHGPLAKLNARREGSLFFMRATTLVGQGPFTLEARVEDLVGHTSGSVEAPVRVGRNAPSLVATDAIAVRPFKGSADVFEADQVLSYDGEALSPVLQPVFRADRPVDLQIYLRLYPDIHGDPLDLSMEVLNQGRVVARMSLPFKGALSDSAREGPSNGVGGSSGIIGGQAKEFPYLVNLKGARFPPGDYLGIVTIRQGKSVVRRVVSFQVTGTGAPARVQIASASNKGPSAPEEDTASIVLPEIQPATIDSSGLKMRDEEQKQLWNAAARGAMGYLDQLPNFRCIQETHRFTAPVKTPDQLKETDSYLQKLIFEDRTERYQRLDASGEKPDDTPAANKGISSRNEFGSMLRGLFDPDVAATYHWAGRSMTLGVLCQVFEFEVSRAKSNFILQAGKTVAAGYTGRAFIDEDSGMVRRLIIQGTDLPGDFSLQSPSLSLDYGMVRIGEKDYLLPLRSVLQLRQGKTFVRNETVFRGYRKFEAESHIKFAK